MPEKVYEVLVSVREVDDKQEPVEGGLGLRSVINVSGDTNEITLKKIAKAVSYGAVTTLTKLDIGVNGGMIMKDIRRTDAIYDCSKCGKKVPCRFVGEDYVCWDCEPGEDEYMDCTKEVS